jgi:hypothetical protein
LKSVRLAYRCSAGFIYRTLYHQLELRRRHRLYPWPFTVGSNCSVSRGSSGMAIPGTLVVLGAPLLPASLQLGDEVWMISFRSFIPRPYFWETYVKAPGDTWQRDPKGPRTPGLDDA